MQCLDKTTQTPNPRLLLERKVNLLGILTECLSPLLELVDTIRRALAKEYADQASLILTTCCLGHHHPSVA